MEIIVTVVILGLVAFAAYCFIKAHKLGRNSKPAINQAEAIRKQVEADLAAYRKIQQSHDTAMKKSRPVANSDKVLKPSRPAKSSDDTVYGFTSYDSGSTYTDSGSSGGCSSDSSSSYSSGGSSYDSGSSSSSSSDSGSSSSSCD
jgi:uncharacterized membrane protein YgcG